MILSDSNYLIKALIDPNSRVILSNLQEFLREPYLQTLTKSKLRIEYIYSYKSSNRELKKLSYDKS